MAAANSNGCLADLRLDDPELRRQAIKSLFAEKTFISHSSMKPRSNNRFCRKWQRMSFGLGHRWMPKDMDRASLGMNRPSEACSIEGLGNDIRVATMSFADIARRSKEAEAQFLLQASKWQQGFKMSGANLLGLTKQLGRRLDGMALACAPRLGCNPDSILALMLSYKHVPLVEVSVKFMAT
eukprot:TRINITY_DN11216_c0_g1_i1.p1 TRINITY_DN11216_c0_g1~~TRINITY_DN11216_c0_g1_i1.p1  ORF type:complete len:202 (-),score=18.76 TRINITY_DN11216_c0_g1_i1:102-647(-)